jgi:hypothetical protein
MPFTMTIKEIKTIEASIAELTEAEKNALPAREDVSMGTSGTSEIGNSTIKKIAQSVGFAD